MIRAFVFMLKVALLIAATIWVADRPGTVSIEWMGKSETYHLGVVLLVLIYTMLLANLIFLLLKSIGDFPADFRDYRKRVRRDKGYRALTLGLTAVAAGDAREAGQQAQKAVKFLPDDTGLPLLLKAQSERLDGREDDARLTFAALLEDKDAAFLGVRGLLQAALDMENYSKALELGHEALKLHPKQPWILKVVYDLEIKTRDWERAREILKRAEKAGAIDSDKACSDRVAMLLAEGDRNLQDDKRQNAFDKFKKANGIDGAFVPAAARLARLYIQKGHRRKAVSTIEKAWKAGPHPELVPLWILAAPKSKNKHGDSKSRIKWLEHLRDLNPKSAEARIALAREAMDDELWGEARAHLSTAEELEPSKRVYLMMAELEEHLSGDEEAPLVWLDKADDAPPERQWVCSETGRVYPVWAPVADPHGSFNTIEWTHPEEGSAASLMLSDGTTGGVFLESPKS